MCNESHRLDEHMLGIIVNRDDVPVAGQKRGCDNKYASSSVFQTSI
jgi:hypothetical protein